MKQITKMVFKKKRGESWRNIYQDKTFNRYDLVSYDFNHGEKYPDNCGTWDTDLFAGFQAKTDNPVLEFCKNVMSFDRIFGKSGLQYSLDDFKDNTKAVLTWVYYYYPEEKVKTRDIEDSVNTYNHWAYCCYKMQSAINLFIGGYCYHNTLSYSELISFCVNVIEGTSSVKIEIID